jgi:hypothetical protein
VNPVLLDSLLSDPEIAVMCAEIIRLRLTLRQRVPFMSEILRSALLTGLAVQLDDLRHIAEAFEQPEAQP